MTQGPRRPKGSTGFHMQVKEQLPITNANNQNTL